MSDHDQGEPTNPTDASVHRPGIILNPDGKYTRLIQFPCTPATQDHNSPVLSKDIPLNPQNQTWLRLYLPRKALDSSSSSSSTKLPLIVYFHGGGFVFLSASTTMIHDFCADVAAQLDVVIVSVEYRLAPEHCLPVAYEDAVEALHCIKTTRDTWITDFADISRCFLMGTSSGGNIVYNAGLRAAAVSDDFEPLRIQGLILHHPFFGGSERTGSELRLANGPELTLFGYDTMWKLALPRGADRDHEYCNPTVGGGSEWLDRIRVLGWRILVSGCYGDLLIDRQIELSKILEVRGVRTVAYFSEGYHGMEVSEPSKAKELFGVIENFI